MAPNAEKDLPPIASKSESNSLAELKSSKKLKKLLELNEKMDKIFTRFDNLEEFIKTHCNNITNQIKTTAQARGNRFFKTKLCRFYQSGYCYHGNNCKFAHGESELRPLLD